MSITFRLSLTAKVFIDEGQSQRVQIILPGGRNLISSLGDSIVVFSDVCQTAKQCKRGQKYVIGKLCPAPEILKWH